ncbi:MAG: cobyrinate a,c-diamide synthase [Thermoanaerobaculales bacterium]|jgi:cobyrinic acid a,c-diamide synthase|nr:cobyrinate a,c-diamide synthase [Thermoanaerobaculales bacterium]
MRLRTPRLVVAGLSGDGGKTLVSLGLCRALGEGGRVVQAFKKGPDYIDAAWLAAATGRPCRNLDPFLMEEEAMGRAVAADPDADLLLVEGNRGLFDGVDAAGSHSTATLAKLLGAPVILVVNTTKVTRTAAAAVLGCTHLDPELDIAGVILNRVATARQERVVRDAVENATGVPVIGAIPKIKGDDPLPDRHLGLVTAVEHPRRDEAIVRAAAAVAANVDLEQVWAIASAAPEVEIKTSDVVPGSTRVTIGYFSDQAFSFYYPENLESLQAAGARLVEVSPSGDSCMPDVDGLYIGGGFPEVHAARLAESRDFAQSVRERVDRGMPVYAECGGLMYLARQLEVGGATYPMSGVLDLVIRQTDRPQGHGYEQLVIDRENPFFAIGTELVGHEFHYSKIVDGSARRATVGEVARGSGTGECRDGIVVGRVWASYLHLHASATPQWAAGFLECASAHAHESAPSAAAWG